MGMLRVSRLVRELLLCIVVPIVLVVSGCALRPDGPPPKPIVKNASPQEGSNASQDVMAAQIPLVAVAERLRNSAGSSDSLGGIRIDVENKTVELWWKGSLGESQRASVEKAKRQGIKLNVGVSKYSQSELLAAIQKYLGGRPSVPKELAYL